MAPCLRLLLADSAASATPIPVLPLIEPLSPKRGLYPHACLAQCPCPEWLTSWDHTSSTPQWPAWDVIFHPWSTSDLDVAYPQGVLRQPQGHSLVLYVYSAGNRLSRNVQDEVCHHSAEVIILDSASQRMLTVLLPDRYCLWTIHYGRIGQYRGAAIPTLSTTLHSAFNAILSNAAQGPHTIYRDVHVAVEPRGQPPRWPPLAT